MHSQGTIREKNMLAKKKLAIEDEPCMRLTENIDNEIECSDLLEASKSLIDSSTIPLESSVNVSKMDDIYYG